MQIQVEFMASLRRPKHLDRLAIIEVPESSNLKQVLKLLEYSFNEIRAIQAFKIDGTRYNPKEIMNEGEHVFLTIPVGGG